MGVEDLIGDVENLDQLTFSVIFMYNLLDTELDIFNLFFEPYLKVMLL